MAWTGLCRNCDWLGAPDGRSRRLLGNMLPATQHEKRLMGETGNEVLKTRQHRRPDVTAEAKHRTGEKVEAAISPFLVAANR